VVRVVVMAESPLLAELVAKALREDSRLRVTAVVGGRRELQLPAVWRAIEEADAALYVPERPLETLPWREELPTTKRVVLLADLLGQVGPERALQLGAGGYIGRGDAATALVEQVIEAVHRNTAAPHLELAGEQNAGRPAGNEAPSLPGLTPEDGRLMQWLVDGETAKEIGAHLKIREGAARSRLRRLREKLGARSLRDLVTLAMPAGFRPRKEEGQRGRERA
jgi:DNA-binding NarL/FixJ family response regulator